jgi:hypothetical protein
MSCDEDNTPFDTRHVDGEDQLGRPSHNRGPFQLELESTSDSRTAKTTSRVHTNSIFDVLPMLGKNFISFSMELVSPQFHWSQQELSKQVYI